MTLARCSTNGRLGHVHAGAVRRQRVGDGAHRVLVLLEVLARACQRGRQGEVVGVVAGAPDRAGQHAGGDQPALEADEHLRGGAEQAVDAERPAARVALGQARAAASAGRSASSARPRRSRASTTFSSSPPAIRATASADDELPVGAAAGAVGERDRVGRRSGVPPCRTAAGGQGTADADRRHPPAVRPRCPTTTSGTHQHATAESPSAKANEPKATGPEPGSPTSSRTTAVPTSVLPPPLGVARTGRGPVPRTDAARPSPRGPRRGGPRPADLPPGAGRAEVRGRGPEQSGRPGTRGRVRVRGGSSRQVSVRARSAPPARSQMRVRLDVLPQPLMWTD